jgi:hypothetical protein
MSFPFNFFNTKENYKVTCSYILEPSSKDLSLTFYIKKVSFLRLNSFIIREYNLYKEEDMVNLCNDILVIDEKPGACIDLSEVGVLRGFIKEYAGLEELPSLN